MSQQSPELPHAQPQPAPASPPQPAYPYPPPWPVQYPSPTSSSPYPTWANGSVAGSATRRNRLGLGILIGSVIGLLAGAIGSFVLMAIIGGTAGVGSFGEDPVVDDIVAMCRGGDMASCDLLYWESRPGSELERFATTCGDRIENPAGDYCVFLDPNQDAGTLNMQQSI